jgi:hypothetical protein
MPDQIPDPEEPETEADRNRANLMILGAAVILVVGGVWLVNALIDANKAEECMESGQRNCNPITIDRDSR